MKRFIIDIHPEDIVNNFTKAEIIKLYGGSDFLLSEYGINYRELVKSLDTDALLEAIGEDAIRDYMNPKVVA